MWKGKPTDVLLDFFHRHLDGCNRFRIGRRLAIEEELEGRIVMTLNDIEIVSNGVCKEPVLWLLYSSTLILMSTNNHVECFQCSDLCLCRPFNERNEFMLLELHVYS